MWAGVCKGWLWCCRANVLPLGCGLRWTDVKVIKKDFPFFPLPLLPTHSSRCHPFVSKNLTRLIHCTTTFRYLLTAALVRTMTASIDGTFLVASATQVCRLIRCAGFMGTEEPMDTACGTFAEAKSCSQLPWSRTSMPRRISVRGARRTSGPLHFKPAARRYWLLASPNTLWIRYHRGHGDLHYKRT